MVFVLIQRVFPILERKHARVGSRGTQRSQRALKAKGNIKVSLGSFMLVVTSALTLYPLEDSELL